MQTPDVILMSCHSQTENGPVLAAPDNRLATRLLRLGSAMRECRHHLQVNEHISYPVSYIGEVLLFVSRLCSESESNREIISVNGRDWFAGKLPVIHEVSVEIAPTDIVSYSLLAVDTDPLRRLEADPELVDELTAFIERHYVKLRQEAVSH